MDRTITEQDLRAIQQMVRLEVRLALKEVYARTVQVDACYRGFGGLVDNVPPIDMDWVRRSVVR